MPFKYTLVVTQYFWSVHTKVIHRPEDFRNAALIFVEELQNYKRSNQENPKPIHLGDLALEHYREDSRRQNINDSGDIYFIHSDNLDALSSMEKRCKSECAFYKDNFDKRTKAYKNALRDVENHHDIRIFEQLVSKHLAETESD